MSLGAPSASLGGPWVPLGPLGAPFGHLVTEKWHFQECVFYCSNTYDSVGWGGHGGARGGQVGPKGYPWVPWVVLGPLRLRQLVRFFFRRSA